MNASEKCFQKACNNNNEKEFNVKAKSAPNLSSTSSKFIIRKNSIELKREKVYTNHINVKSKIIEKNNKINGNSLDNNHVTSIEVKKDELKLKFNNKKYFKSYNHKRIIHFSSYSSVWKFITKISNFLLNLLTIFIFMLALVVLLPIKLLKVSIFKLLFY